MLGAVKRAIRAALAREQPPQGVTMNVATSFWDSLNVLVTDFNQATESEDMSVRISPIASGNSGAIRFLVSTRYYCLSFLASNAAIEVFRFPAADLLLPDTGENAATRRVRLVWKNNSWYSDGATVSAEDLNLIVRTLFHDLVTYSYRDAYAIPEHARLPLLPNGESFVGRIKGLVSEKNRLLERVVSEHESVQEQISRDIHDAVISELMSLKGAVVTNRLSAEEAGARLDKAIAELRSICRNLSPREIHDWGLETILGDLLNSFAERTDIDCMMECNAPMPPFNGQVQLHVFRIMQECLNNVERHAKATAADLKIDVQREFVSFTLTDNGIGKRRAGEEVSQKGTRGGWGSITIKERVDLIRCHLPAVFSVEDGAAGGTTATLKISLTALVWLIAVLTNLFTPGWAFDNDSAHKDERALAGSGIHKDGLGAANRRLDISAHVDPLAEVQNKRKSAERLLKLHKVSAARDLLAQILDDCRKLDGRNCLNYQAWAYFMLAHAAGSDRSQRQHFVDTALRLNGIETAYGYTNLVQVKATCESENGNFAAAGQYWELLASLEDVGSKERAASVAESEKNYSQAGDAKALQSLRARFADSDSDKQAVTLQH